MRRASGLVAGLLAVVAASGCGGGQRDRAAGEGSRAESAAIFSAADGHSVAGFSMDGGWLSIAEDPAAAGACPLVVLMRIPDGAPEHTLTSQDGPSCTFGGTFWVRPGMRAIGEARAKALWVLRNGSSAIAVKGSTTESEVVLVRVNDITDRGPFLGPVVATNWLRLFGLYSIDRDGKELTGGAISGNNRELWADTGPVLPLGLDDEEHAVSVGEDGSIAMWQAHGARYGRVPDAHARAATLDDGRVLVLRSDRPRLDLRLLSGKLVRSWPVVRNAAPLLDADVAHHVAVYIAGRAVHELRLDTGADRVVARAPQGTALLDAQLDRGSLAYAYRGGPAGGGRVVVIAR
jgi:hypothetical protein